MASARNTGLSKCATRGDRAAGEVKDRCSGLRRGFVGDCKPDLATELLGKSEKLGDFEGCGDVARRGSCKYWPFSRC